MRQILENAFSKFFFFVSLKNDFPETILQRKPFYVETRRINSIFKYGNYDLLKFQSSTDSGTFNPNT
jgi:hypothetical protein